MTETVRRQPARDASARTYARALPIVPVRARGMTIEGADGRRYLDCLSGDGALVLGHNHPVVLAAVREVLDSGAPIGVLDLTTPVEERFVAELLATLPPGLARGARVRFCGPTAADAAAVASGLLRGAAGVAGAARGVVEPVVEPVCDERLRRLRETTREQGVPLIVDETVTGVGRTGAFWAVEHSGVTPDAMVLAEAIGGSLPLAVVVHRADLDTVEPTAAPRGNQLAMAAGAATLAHVREHRLAERAAVVGGRLGRGLRELAARFPAVAEVQGRGLMLGLRFAADGFGGPGLSGAGLPGAGLPAAGLPASTFAGAVRRECLRRGLIVGLGGPNAEVVRLLPPLTVSDEQADAVLQRLADAVEAVAGVARRS
ncbi:aminotransferase class III-fold pyridoxal phosphate-dependent enzyme [Streptomyces sp. NPDC002640]